MPVLGVSSLNSGRACHGPFFWLPLSLAGRHSLCGWSLLGRQWAGQQHHLCLIADLFEQAGHESLDDACRWQSLVARFIHIKRPIDFDLQRMPTQAGRSVALRAEAAGVGLVAVDPEAAAAEPALGAIHQVGGAGLAMIVAQHDVDAVVALA